MIKRFKPKSEFNRNVLTLMTGASVAQAIPIAISPILTRIYTPEDFGVLALFGAISVTFGSIANGRYELAIMLPKEDDDAINIAALGLFIAFIFSFVLLIPAVFLNDQITRLLGNEEVGFWLYFVPFSMFMTGFYNVLNYLNTRQKSYKDIAQATIYRSLVSASFQVGLGILKSGAAGLISGQLASQLVANFRLARNVQSSYQLQKITNHKMKKLAFRYKNFPLFSSWGDLANNLSIHLVNVLVSIFYNISTLGFLILAQKVLQFPSIIIGSTLGQVFYQEATYEKQKTGLAVKSYKSTFKKLIVVSLISFVPLYFIVEDLFVFVFGENWRLAGAYAMILIPLIAVQFISSALSGIFNVFEKQKVVLIWQVILLINTIGIVSASKILGWGFESFLYIFSGCIGFQYLIYGYMSYRISMGDRFSSKRNPVD